MPASETVTEDPAAAASTIEVTMPPTGSETQVTVTGWIKHPGDRVAEHEPICLVDWGDDTAEVASPATGVMRMVTVAAGEQVTVGATLAVIDLGVGPPGTGRFESGPPDG